MDEKVGEVFLRLIFRMELRPSKRREMKVQKTERAVGRKKRDLGISRPPMSEHLGGQSSEH